VSLSKNKKKRRERLFNEHPYCHWCGVGLIQIEHIRHKSDPSNMATIDHRYGKLDPRRKDTQDPDAQSVLSCWGCNNRRGQEDADRLGVEELRRRSRRWPKKDRPLIGLRHFLRVLLHRAERKGNDEG